MGEEYFRRHGKEPDYIWRGVVQKPTLYAVRVITDTVLEEYRKGRLDKVYVIFTHYVNAAVQEPVMIKLLPLSVENLKDAKVEYDYSGDILFDPSRGGVREGSAAVHRRDAFQCDLAVVGIGARRADERNAERDEKCGRNA